MKTDLFDYVLPPELIAQKPAGQRDQSRLLVVDRGSCSVAHRRFRDLPEFLRAGDCLVRNVARVLPARLFGQRDGGGAVECLLVRPAAGATPNRWWSLLRPGRKLPPGAGFSRPGEFTARVIEKSAAAEYLVEFAPAHPDETVLALAERLGRVPLPPYIHRDDASAEAAPSLADTLDRERYQTVYADPQHTVAIAAPTAGLHFTDALLDAVRARGVTFADVILHVGLGTFRPIESRDIEQHQIHRETVEIPPATRRSLRESLPGSGRRIAVGTTAVRAVEWYRRQPAVNEADARQAAAPFRGEADLFIVPPFEFHAIEALVTNFHLPRSTLMCLVAAFLSPGSADGIAWLREIYAEAVRERYRFLSYGDAMLIV